MWLSFVHSIKMCLIEYWFPHGHFGGGSSFRMKEWVSWVCPMRSRVRVVSPLPVLLGSSFLSFKIGSIWIKYGLLPPISQTIQVWWTRHSEHYRQSKDKLISNVLLWTPTPGHTSVGWPAKTYQPYVDTGCCLDDLTRAITDWDG